MGYHAGAWEHRVTLQRVYTKSKAATHQRKNIPKLHVRQFTPALSNTLGRDANALPQQLGFPHFLQNAKPHTEITA